MNFQDYDMAISGTKGNLMPELPAAAATGKTADTGFQDGVCPCGCIR